MVNPVLGNGFVLPWNRKDGGCDVKARQSKLTDVFQQVLLFMSFFWVHAAFTNGSTTS